jgi:hypothetical protein
MKFKNKFKFINLMQSLAFITHAEVEDKMGPLSSENIFP